jgi:IS30 family transposase
MITVTKLIGNGLMAISKALGRAPRTIFRERERNPPLVRTQNNFGEK